MRPAPGDRPTPQPHTIELPLTPPLRDLVARERLGYYRWSLRWVLYGSGFVFLMWMAGVPCALATGGWSVLPQVFSPILVLTLVLTAAFIGLALLWAGRPAGRDLREATYRRTSGPASWLPPSGHGGQALLMVGCHLRYGDMVGGHRLHGTYLSRQYYRLNLPDSQSGGRAPWLTVDYTKHGPLIFEIRDERGQCIYRLPGYEPADLPEGPDVDANGIENQPRP